MSQYYAPYGDHIRLALGRAELYLFVIDVLASLAGSKTRSLFV